MNDIFYYVLLFIILVIILLGYILISFFYNKYTDYETTTNNNFQKTQNYINTSTKIIDTNIKTLDGNYKDMSKLHSTNISNLNDKINLTSNLFDISLNRATSNLNERDKVLQTNINTTNTNLNNYDMNMKKYFEFKDQGSVINNALFNYQFTPTSVSSINIISEIAATSGMTVRTDANSKKNFNVCDNGIGANMRCMNLNVKDKDFNLYSVDANVSNFNILNNNNKPLAIFDINNNSIYFGSNLTDSAFNIENNTNININQDININKNKNLKICDNQEGINKKCINLNVNQGVFNMADNNNKIFSSYNLNENKYYFGSSNATYSPFYIEGNQAYVNGIQGSLSNNIYMGNSNISYINSRLQLLKPLAFSGSYGDITGVPTFSAVATSGSYNDLLNKPS